MSYEGRFATKLPGESYSCTDCSVESYTREQVQDDWLCPGCKNPVLIHAHNPVSGEDGTFYRIRASDIVKGHWLKPGHLQISQIYEVLGVEKINKNTIGVGLRGYTRITLHPDEWVSRSV
ncbi:TPA: hypothetical protein N5N91_004549 [Enterobacter roggenkampii]|nr:hypothetical protein [Enterobacter roggenkampii]